MKYDTSVVTYKIYCMHYLPYHPYQQNKLTKKLS